MADTEYRAWDGFATLRFPGPRDLQVCADYGGPDDNPIPLAVLRQPTYVGDRHDVIELTEAELRWVVEIAPALLERMAARP